MRGFLRMNDWVLYTRAGCGLCEQLYAQLIHFQQSRGVDLDVQLIDVDAKVEIRALYNARVPVLEYRGETICQYHFCAEAVEKQLSH